MNYEIIITRDFSCEIEKGLGIIGNNMFNDVEVEIVRGCHEFIIGLRQKRASCLWANSVIVCLICVDVRLNKVILGNVLRLV